MKPLRYIILLKTVLLLTFVNNQVHAYTAISLRQIIKKNDTIKPDSIKLKGKKSSGLNDKVEYKAQDSTKYSKDRSIVYLYGKARVIYQTFELDADFIRYDSKNNLIFASGSINPKTKRYVGRPIFKMEEQGSSIADSLIYNTKTGKGRVFNTFTAQEGGFFSGGQSKKQVDDEIHVKDIIYSTCNLPHPHFGIHISKGIVTEKQIVTGPVYLEFEDVPLPLVLPFGFFPKPNKRSSGIIFPNFGEDYTRGFFLRDAGYYLGLNDYWDAKILGSIYTRGSYEASLMSNYTKRYKFNGNLSFRYASTRNGLEGTPAYKPNKDFNLTWSHNQNANARPGTTFGASVNFGTGSYFSNTAANGTYDINQIARNTMQSSISFGKVFGKDGLFNFNSSLSHRQDIQQKTVYLQLPEFSLNMSSLNPFDSKNRVGEQKWYQRISMGYALTGSNTVDTKEDLLFKSGGLKRFKNGFNHNIPISMSFNVLKYFHFNAGTSFSEKWYLQTINKTLFKRSNLSDSTAIDTISGFKRAGEYSLSMGMSTKIYATKQFNSLGNFKAIRHVMTPSFSFSYKPDFSDPKLGYYKELHYQDGSTVIDPYFKRAQRYSIFEQGIYGGPSQGKQASLSFNIDNTVEAKIHSKKDTVNNGDKKVPIIQGLGINGAYNFIAPAFKLSTFGFNGRSQFTDKLGINYYGTLDPYQVADSLNNGNRVYYIIDRYTWKDGKLPRLTNLGFSFDYSFNSEAVKAKNKNVDDLKNAAPKAITPDQANQLAAISRDPNAFVDFNIPWNFSFSYSFQYSNPLASTKSITNTLNFNGDFSVTPKWKVQFTSGFDFKAKNFAYTSFNIYRDLHCWDMSFSWVPFGAYQSYSVDIKVKAAILQDLKLSKRKGYYTRF